MLCGPTLAESMRGGPAMIFIPFHRRRGRSQSKKQVARTAAFAARVFSAAILVTVLYSITVSKLRPSPSGTGLRRPFLYDRRSSVAVGRPKR
jgi:hypothetical protein